MMHSPFDFEPSTLDKVSEALRGVERAEARWTWGLMILAVIGALAFWVEGVA